MAEVDLLSALRQFKDGVQQHQLSQAINSANEQVNQIRSSDEAEHKKRQALQQVSQNLVSYMAGSGVPETTIAEVAGRFGPQNVASAEQAILQGQLQGGEATPQGQFLTEAGARTNTLLAAERAKEAAKARAFEGELLGKKLEGAQEVAQVKANAKKINSAFGNEQIKQITAGLSQIKNFDKLNSMVENNPNLVGPVAGRIPGRGSVMDAEYGRFKLINDQLFNAYRQMITGAGASEKEIENLKKAWPQGTESKSVYTARLAEAKQQAEQSLSARIGALEAEGKDTSALKSLLKKYNIKIEVGSGASGSYIPEGVVKTVRNKKTGQIQKVMVMPDGKMVPIE